MAVLTTEEGQVVEAEVVEEVLVVEEEEVLAVVGGAIAVAGAGVTEADAKGDERITEI